MYFWLCWVSVAACRFFLVAIHGLLIVGASVCWGAWALGMQASVIVECCAESLVLPGLFSSCSEWGYSLVKASRLLIAVAALIAEHGLRK